jgi:hypothetical protein
MEEALIAPKRGLKRSGIQVKARYNGQEKETTLGTWDGTLRGPPA